MKLIKTVRQSYAHEYRQLGDLHTSYGFGETPEDAREDALYGTGGNAARDHGQGFGDWKVQEDRDGEHWLIQINKSAA
jgi:hypothetical protein